ncbi:ComF family protein [Leptolyngbya sp. PCC 6406]|uniref:ComF family protein n=1 Tax=Leptolyngbya sp. PCC 6406 TaxID=1173264 RepID=UPI0002ABDFA5|nr:ComF family protein [Leptolyngbya sp. PCC 6406]
MWSQALTHFTSLWLQQPCPLCDRAHPAPLCDRCWQQLQSCQWVEPPQREADALTVLTWGRYQHPLKRAIAALKYEGHRYLATPLGQALGQRWQQTPIPTRQPPWVIPIPLHPQKQRDRGFNQAALIADAFCHQTGLTLLARGLQRQRATLPQFGLGVTERQQNLANAFALGPDLLTRPQSHPILLVDDIYTTGTTVRAAAAVLRRHGWSVCGVVAIARSVSDQA